MSSIDYLNLCRLCLVKESAFVPIFDGEGDSRQIFHKIAACLPVKVTRDDKLPKKICNECVQKIELFYQFCNTTTNAEKQLLEWIGGVDLNDKQTYVSAVINQDQSSNNRLDGNVMQQTNEQHQNNIDMNMMESIGLEMPMMIQQNQTQMTINYTNNTNAQSMQSNTIAQQQNNSKNMEESDDDHCGGDDDMGQNEELSVKEEIQDSNRTIEPTFVSVSSPCEEAGPSGLQQKSGDIPDGQFLAGQSTDGDPKSGSVRKVLSSTKEDKSKVNGSLQKLQKPVITKPPNQASVIIYLPENITSNTGGSPVKVVDITKLINQKKLRLVNIKSLNINNPSKINNTPNIIKKETVINCHECSTCKKTFPSSKLLKTHLVTHSDARPYKCKVCDKTFKRSCTLAIHNKIHAKERKYICEVCQRAFIQKAALEVHRRRHFENFTLHCEHCNKGFVTKAEHHAHMNVKHGAREHVCTTCQNSYPNNHSLVRHMKKHDPNYKPLLYNCNDCDKSFLSKRSLIAHIGNHTGQRKKFKCDICGKYISSNASLQDHLRLHRGDKPYVCDVCGHTFHKRGTLVTHQRTHTGERPYSCDICNKSFTQRSSLVIHKRYHTGERPYECSYCEKNFVSRALLNGHAKVHR